MVERKPERRAGLTRDEVVGLCGDIEDWKVAAIIATGASHAELEQAVVWSMGETDLMGEERKPLAGRVAEIHEILTRDEVDEREYPNAV